MSVITLTSDLGLQDYYVASIKGKLISQLPTSSIIDITHQIPAFDTIKAAMVLKKCFYHFPEQTIHLVAVNNSSLGKDKHVVVKYKNHFFIGIDNGLFTVLLDEQPEAIIELDETNYHSTRFIDNAITAIQKLLATNFDLLAIGKPIEKLSERQVAQPYMNGEVLVGQITYFDIFENAITNIHESMLKVYEGKRIMISVRGNEIEKISANYDSEPKGEIVALVNASGFLEIAMNEGTAKSLLNLRQGDSISVSVIL